MNCTNCGATLPPGATICPNCGVATPYNAARSGNPAQYEPTVYAPPPQYNMPPSGNENPPYQLDPTVVSTPYKGTPQTSYGSPEIPPPPGQNPYAPTPPNSYNAPQPQYGTPPPQQGAYMPPPLAGGGYAPYGAQPPKKRSRVGMIIGIILLVVLLACIGVSLLVYNGIKQGVSSVTATVTASANTVTSEPATPTVAQPTSPSGQSIDPTAASIITNLQTASSIDQNQAIPTQLATTFTVQQPIYATVNLDMHGQTGYAQAKWYADGQLQKTSTILTIDKPTYVHAYFGFAYSAATQGIVEVYFCTQSDCSDAKLAAVTNFTVTSTGLHWQHQPSIVMMDINRP